MKMSKIVKSFKVELTLLAVLTILLAGHYQVSKQLDQHIVEYSKAVNQHVVYGDIRIVD